MSDGMKEKQKEKGSKENTENKRSEVEERGKEIQSEKQDWEKELKCT